MEEQSRRQMGQQAGPALVSRLQILAEGPSRAFQAVMQQNQIQVLK